MDSFNTSKIFKIHKVENTLSESLFDSAKNETGNNSLEVVDQFLFGYTFAEGINGVYSLTAVIDKNSGAQNIYISPYGDDNTILDKNSTNAYVVYAFCVLADALKDFSLSFKGNEDDDFDECNLPSAVLNGCAVHSFDAAADEHILNTLSGRWI